MIVTRTVQEITSLADRGLGWVSDRRRATYGTALVRIAFGGGAFVFLLAHLPNRAYLWGEAARWAAPLDDNGGFTAPFTVFAGGLPAVQLTVAYLVVTVLAALVTIGWRSRWVTPVFLVLWVSLLESNPLTGDQSDNIFRILLLYLCFADLGGRWSLDARRRARTVARYGQPRPLGRFASERANAQAVQLGTLLHNFAVIMAGAQICLIYVASGLYKAQGLRWQDGTAIYYPLQLSHYRPWPWLADLLVQNTLMVAAVTYFSVFIQLFFPLMLLRRWTRIIAILGVFAMHTGIAIAMGLPFFSLFIMAGDCLFVRDTTFAAIQSWVRARGSVLAKRWRRRAGRSPEDRAAEPQQETAEGELARQ
ncbi:HTTM domain-containing protein [Isoptericola croceus]|uniref:HTTM domain-containing protein n=1 Tax=Isoptericola croceus TaxID=3031406 RepID=UPI0023F884B5|nr:HTTM domain-containing protein [Isoptericola croceus]